MSCSPLSYALAACITMWIARTASAGAASNFGPAGCEALLDAEDEAALRYTIIPTNIATGMDEAALAGALSSSVAVCQSHRDAGDEVVAFLQTSQEVVALPDESSAAISAQEAARIYSNGIAGSYAAGAGSVQKVQATSGNMGDSLVQTATKSSANASAGGNATKPGHLHKVHATSENMGASLVQTAAKSSASASTGGSAAKTGHVHKVTSAFSYFGYGAHDLSGSVWRSSAEARSNAGTGTNTSMLLAVLLVGLPLMLALVLLVYDCLNNSQSAQELQARRSPSLIPARVRGAQYSRFSAASPSDVKRMTAWTPGQPKPPGDSPPGPDLQHASTWPRPQQGEGSEAVSFSGPRASLINSDASFISTVDPGEGFTLPKAYRWRRESSKGKFPGAPLVPQWILPVTEARFRVSLEQLEHILTEQVVILGYSGRPYLNVSYSEEVGIRKLEIAPVLLTGNMKVAVTSEQGSSAFQVYDNRGELYGTVCEGNEGGSPCFLFTQKDQPAPSVQFDLGDTKYNMLASLVDSGSVGSAKLAESDEGMMFRARVAPGQDWVLVISVFLALIAMRP